MDKYRITCFPDSGPHIEVWVDFTGAEGVHEAMKTLGLLLTSPSFTRVKPQEAEYVESQPKP